MEADCLDTIGSAPAAKLASGIWDYIYLQLTRTICVFLCRTESTAPLLEKRSCWRKQTMPLYC